MPTPTTSVSTDPENGIRISDAAAAAGVSPRTLRYYEELGLLTPSLYTPGGERRYTESDLTQLHRILELREVLGMNLDEIKEFLSFETRLDVLRTDYRAKKDATTPDGTRRAKGDLAGGARTDRIAGGAVERQAGPDGQPSGRNSQVMLRDAAIF